MAPELLRVLSGEDSASFQFIEGKLSLKCTLTLGWLAAHTTFTFAQVAPDVGLEPTTLRLIARKEIRTPNFPATVQEILTIRNIRTSRMLCQLS